MIAEGKSRSASASRSASNSKDDKGKKVNRWREYKRKLVPGRFVKMMLPLKTDILHLIQGNFPEASISDTGMDVLGDLIVELAVKLVKEGNNLRQLGDKQAEYISQRDIESAFKLYFHGDFLSIMQARAKYVVDHANAHDKEKKSNS